MTLIDCPVCARQASAGAERCPRCGHLNRAAAASNESRRHFLRWTAAAAAACTAGVTKRVSAQDTPAPGRGRSGGGNSLRLGLTTYTLRAFGLDQALAMTRRVGLKYISLKSVHLPLDAPPEKIAAVAAKVRQAGLDFYGVGVITLAKEAQVAQAFDYAKAAGVRRIMAAPTAAMLPAVEQAVKKYGIALAIHNHGPEDKNFPTPESVYRKVRDLDRRVGLCIDISHTVRAGVDPVEAVLKYGDRLLDVHMKDLRQTGPRWQDVPVGRGVIDIPAFFRALRRVKYGGVVAFEYEADAKDPLPGLAESVGYARGVLAAL
jgi:sugar phosphate isomerase/epimerase